VDVFARLKDTLVEIGLLLPRLFLALVILAAGYMVARLLERVVDNYLDRVQFDRSAERWGVADAVERTGTPLHPARVVGKLLFWAVMLVVILLAAAALPGVTNVNDLFTNLVAYIPGVFAAIIVIVLGLVLGEFVRGLILASAGGVEGVPLLAKLAKGVIIAVAVIMALQQMGVPVDVVTTTFTLILGAVALAVALAFGLGNTALAGEITRRWYERGRRAPEAAPRRAEPGSEAPAEPRGGPSHPSSGGATAAPRGER
jgi:hypothetical protein